MKRINANKLAIAMLSAVTVWSSSSLAATATSNLTVSADVTANCSISTSPLAFGSYDPAVTHATTDLDGTGTVSVTCTSGASATITLGQGANADTGSTDAAPLRRMSDGATSHLNFALYSDSGRSTAWNNDAAGQVATTGTGTTDAHTVYGRIAAGQNVPAGSYSDTVVATVTF